MESGQGQEIGRVIGLKGEARAEGFEEARTLDKGDPVYQGEKIITGAGSNVEIKFLDDTVLSQGSDSVLRLDEYVFDPQNMESSGLSFNLMQGTFRQVTGRIAEQNPEAVNLESPLSLIGIRGTTTVHNIGPDGESHGAEYITDGFRIIITDSFGEVRIVQYPMVMMDVFPDRPMGFIRPMTPQELEFFREIAQAAIDELGIEDDDPIEDEAVVDDVEAQDEDAEDLEEDGDAPDQDEDLDQVPPPKLFLDETDGEDGDDPDGPEDRMQLQQVQDQDQDDADQQLGDDDDGTDIIISEEEEEEDDPAPDNDPANWETLAQHGGNPDYSWFEDRGFSILAGDDGSNELVLGSPKHAIFGFGGNDTMDAWHGDEGNYLYGGAGNDTIYGSPYDDKIYGGTGNDLLYGYCGNDKIYGGPGNDTLIGGEGGDELWGGSGSNVFKYYSIHDSPADGRPYDRIMDFTDGRDKAVFHELYYHDNLYYLGLEEEGQGNIFTVDGYRAEAKFKYVDGKSMFYVDVNGDGSADMQIEVVGFDIDDTEPGWANPQGDDPGIGELEWIPGAGT